MVNAQLIIVVEVDKDKRVFCQREGCRHSVYKRIHVVLDNGSLSVLGSECFKRFYGDLAKRMEPRYGHASGQMLTDEDRENLVHNTQLLIQKLEAEFLRAETVRKDILHARQHQAKPFCIHDQKPLVSTEQEQAAYLQALEKCGREFPGVNFSLPGWRGVVEQEKKRLLREWKHLL